MQRDKQTISLKCKSADLAMIKASIHVLCHNPYCITVSKLSIHCVAYLGATGGVR